MINNNTTDNLIIRKVLEGDVDSFQEIVSRYERIVRSIGVRFFHNHQDAHDFCQEVFIKVFCSLGKYRGWAPFRFWLTRVAYNHGINRIKARKDEVNITENVSGKPAGAPDAIHFVSEMKAQLVCAIEQLPEKYKVCLDFYFFLGMSYLQISSVTGFPVNTIKSYVFRAKRILRTLLKGTIVEDYLEMTR
jgi:RNA polymerase sigma-70 factor, ECF subfamily